MLSAILAGVQRRPLLESNMDKRKFKKSLIGHMLDIERPEMLCELVGMFGVRVGERP